MHDLAPLIYDLAIMLGLAGVAVLVCQRIHQPVVLGYLIAGMIAGPYTPPYELLKDIPNIQMLSVLGMIFLMFTLGLEFSFRKLKRVGMPALITGSLEVILMMVVGYETGQVMQWSHNDSLFLGAAMAISSTTIIIKVIDELKLNTHRFAELIFGILVVEDLLAILLLVALSTIAITNDVFSMAMVYAAIKLIVVVGGWFLIGYFLVPALFRHVAAYISEETLTVISVALCLLLVAIAAHLNYSVALGAFVMGSILAETTLVHRIGNLMRPIRDIFGALFFISVGMLINPAIIFGHWQAVIFISLITIFGKLLTTTFGALVSGQNVSTSLRVGFSMAQVGEFSFIIAALGLSLQVTSDKLYPLVVAVSVVTTFTTPYLIRFSGFMSERIDGYLPKRLKTMLSTYSSWTASSQDSAEQSRMIRAVAVRLVMNGIIVAIIFALIDEMMFDKLKLYSEQSAVANVFGMLLAIVISAPFVWGMMFSYRAAKMPINSNRYTNPGVYLVWLATFAELAILSILVFQSWLTILVLFLITMLIFGFSYTQLGKFYGWFEDQLIMNIGENYRVETSDNHATETDLVLKPITLNSQHPLVGKEISAVELLNQPNCFVAAIERNAARIVNPDVRTMLEEGDIIYLVGEASMTNRIESMKKSNVK